MRSTAATVEQYIDGLPDERKMVVQKLREVIGKSLPKGFKEGMGYGMISYAVPHSIYPAGYHCDPKLPLPFISIASQKNYIALHHMGLYASTDLLDWFQKEWQSRATGKLEMGKGCIRLKKPEQIPFELISDLATKMTPAHWIEQYESAFTRKSKS